jgi:hypothetical protein
MTFLNRSETRCLLLLLALVAQQAIGQTATPSAQQAQPGRDDTPASIAHRLDELAATLRATQKQMEQSREQMKQIEAQIDALRVQLAGTGVQAAPAAVAVNENNSSSNPENASTAEALSHITEDLDAVKAGVAQQQQTKVESASRLPVRLTGLILFNTFVNRGVVDQIDLPNSALLGTSLSSHISTGASLRQSILGLEGTGPILAGAHTSGRISMDFFGGVTGSAANGPAGTPRLRTAAISAEWKHDQLEASYDAPFITALSPTSYATVAQPALAWSGNLWSWMPQLAWKHVSPLPGKDRQLTFQLGLLDTQTLNAGNNLSGRSTGAGEASGQPSYETRLAFGSGDEAHRLEIGIGGMYGRQRYPGDQRIDTWATTADWQLPIKRLRISGELYRGQGLGSLGGGAYRDAVTYPVPGSTDTYRRALDSQGGWIELSYKLSAVLRANASIGQDSASGSQLRDSVPIAFTSPAYFYARNRSVVGNLVYRPWASILISPEYRRLQSWPITGNVHTANIYTLTFGYQF